MSDTLLLPAASLTVGPHGELHMPPGAVFSLAEGEQLHASAAGLADLETGETMTVAHAFDLASVSKILTTLTLRRLMHIGALTESASLGTIIGARAGAAADMTIDDLMRHRAGLAEWWPLYLLPQAAEDPVATALRLPLKYAPAKDRHYSDLGMQALGAVIAHVSGEPLADAIRSVLLVPLETPTVTPGGPAAGLRAATGPDGDAIEKEMIRSGVPYPVTANPGGFAWRTQPLRGHVADGNAHHAFGGVGGHAGWFSDVTGMRRVAEAIIDPSAHGLGAQSVDAFARALAPGQGQGIMHYRLRWKGRERLFLGHSGFTGTFVAASAAVNGDPKVISILLTNRLHGRPAPGRDRLVPTETLWRNAMARADLLLHPTRTGTAP